MQWFGFLVVVGWCCWGEKVTIPAGSFLMGDGTSTKGPLQGALAQQTVAVSSFEMDSTAASNEEFAEFVEKTGYVTDSEKFKWSFVLELHATEEGMAQSQGAVDAAKHWVAIPGSSWRFPRGPNSPPLNPKHPAGHISYHDAKAYCEFRKGRLPTETEWEYAARGGLKEKKFPWGDAMMTEQGDGRMLKWKANVWQGDFPKSDKAEDGYSGPCPVSKFAPNAFGLYNMVGNVWEWTSTLGPPMDKSNEKQRVLRGASFVDSVDGKFNHQANVNARMYNTEDSASSNTGVRCAYGKTNSGEYRYPKEKPKMDQDTLNRIVEEGGVEALQKYLGKSATVMPAQDMVKRHEEKKRAREEV